MKDQSNYFDDKINLAQQAIINPLGLVHPGTYPLNWNNNTNIERQKNQNKKLQTNSKNASLIQTILRMTKNRDREAKLGEKQKLQNQLTSILPIVKIKMNSYMIGKSENQSNFKKMTSFGSQFYRRKGDIKQQQSHQSENILMIQKKHLNQTELKGLDRYDLPKFISPQKREDIPKLQKIQQQVIQNTRQHSRRFAQLINKSSTLNQSKKLITKYQKYTYFDFIYLVNWTNNMCHKYELSPPYKVFVSKGNNHNLIKNTFRKRSWWNVIQSHNQNINQINFYWTQNKNSRFINILTKQQSIVIDNNNNKIYLKQITSQFKLFGCNMLPPELKKLIPQKDLIYLYKNNNNKNILKSKKFAFYQNPNDLKCHNHLEFHWHLSNKKMLFKNLNQYYLKSKKDPFENIPVTFHVKQQGDQEWLKFVEYFQKRKILKQQQQNNSNVWIVKPGQNTNRGNGIDVVSSIEQVKNIINKHQAKSNKQKNIRTHIIQVYITPFLFHKRKFDIRCYMLVTSVNKKLKAYWYEEGYIRTSSKEFNLKNLTNKMIHLTNDAIQKHSQDYGKYESGNKISFADFQKYLKNTNQKFKFQQIIVPRMQELAKDAICSVSSLLDSNSRQYTFQIFGLDFLIDQNFKVWLIEINTNPCLEISCPMLGDIIPKMIENAFKIALDPIFPPPKELNMKWKQSQSTDNNRFMLIFNAEIQNKKLENCISEKTSPKNDIFDIADRQPVKALINYQQYMNHGHSTQHQQPKKEIFNFKFMKQIMSNPNILQQ